MPNMKAAHHRVVGAVVTAWLALAAPVLAAAQDGSRFGGAGTVLVSGGFQLEHLSPEYGSSGTVLEVSPGLRFFPVKQLAVGFDLQLATVWASGRSTTSLNAVPAIGVVIPISGSVSLFPQAELSLNLVNASSTTATRLGVGAFVPIAVHPPGHFFFAIGPELLADVTASKTPKYTAVGVRTVIGGWF